ncbi:VacJ family lipoprotein [Desulfobacterales bacterium HSG2]|nr:VacJ family lipoprotein [Desulfobacterales bacterium HSG2]
MPIRKPEDSFDKEFEDDLEDDFLENSLLDDSSDEGSEDNLEDNFSDDGLENSFKDDNGPDDFEDDFPDDLEDDLEDEDDFLEDDLEDEDEDDFLDDDLEDDLLDDDLEDDLEDEEDEDAIQVADPLAPWNQLMFRFNDKLYFWVLKPVATGYKAVTPSMVRVGIKNFFQNLTTPIRVANCVLQGKFQTAETEIARFLINSTVGILGFGDVAKNNPRFVRPPDEDLGQTLGSYGIGNGVYIVWPILGPSTLRDTVGTFGDRFLSPVTYVDIPTEATLGITVLETVNETSFRIGDYEAIKDAAIIPYEAFRDAYLQYREKKVENTEEGKSERRYDNLIKKWIK